MEWEGARCARSIDAAHAQVFATQAQAVQALAATPWVGEIVEV